MATKVLNAFASTNKYIEQGETYKTFEESYAHQLLPLDDLFDTIQELPSISSLLKKGRRHYNLSQTELSELTGISTTEISRLESGKILKPSKDVLISLSPYLGCSYNYLLLCSGYSSINTKEIFYNKSKNSIPFMQIVSDIYNADTELLESLSDINKLSYEDIQLLKEWILLLKSSYSTNVNSTLNKAAFQLLINLKNFLSEQISIMKKLFKSTD